MERDAVNPMPRATPNPTTDFPVLEESAFAIGVKITKAESTKMGMETTYPVKANAHSSFLFPIHFRKL